MNHSCAASLGVVILTCIFAASSLAAQPDLCTKPATINDVQFTLALPSGHTAFYQGEIIPLTLSFTSTTKGRYWAAVRNYDRSGRLDIERYCLEPEAPDPLQSYFNVGAMMGGGLSSTRALDATPFTAQADLNEYLSPAPGHYRLFAISDRISRPPDPHEETPYGRISEIVRSNTIEFEVRPAPPQWQQQQLQSALAVLANAPAPIQGPSNPDDPVRRAARQLRFLNTKESAQQLAKLFSGYGEEQPYAWEFSLGLFGSPYRSTVIEAMRKEFAAPNHPITAEFLQSLVRLEITADPAWDTPASFSSDNPPDGKTIEDYWRRRQIHEQELTRAESEDLLTALPGKVGRARGLTALAILNSTSPVAPGLAEELRKSLIASWNDLPASTRDQLIQSQWQLLAGPEMLPILLGIVRQPPPPARTMTAMTRDAALRHLFELDPAAARPLILADLNNPKIEPNLAVLKLLPSEDIAPAIQPAIQRIAHGNARDLDFSLLDHYADASVLGQVQAAFEPNLGKWACAPQSSMLRYFLRVAPEYGATQVAASLRARKETHCYSSLLADMGDQLAPVEHIAIEALDDPDPEIAQNAVFTLGQWGSRASEDALWARLERFHEDWASHPSDLRSTPDYNSPGTRAFNLEGSFVSALAGGTGWLCTPEKLTRLRSLVLTDYNRQQIDNLFDQWRRQPFVIIPNWREDADTTFNLLNSSPMTEDQLRAKIAQFPKGTRLAWQFWQPGQIFPAISMAKQEAVYDNIRASASEHGIALEKSLQP